MAVDKLVDSTQLDADLTSVANAIRTKGGTSAQLAFPAGFVSAVQAIPTGGGGDYVANDWFVASKPTGVLTDSGSGNRPNFQFALYNRTGITGLNFPNATGAQKNGVRDCTNITSISAPNMTKLYESSFNKVGVTTAVFPKVYEIGNYGIISTSMTAIDILGGSTSTVGIAAYGLNGNTALKIIVIRSTSGVMKLYHATNSLGNTPFKNGGTGGTLYVYASMLSGYQSASNWSTVLGYTNNQIKSIESTHTDPDAPIDLTLYYVDGTPIPT